MDGSKRRMSTAANLLRESGERVHPLVDGDSAHVKASLLERHTPALQDSLSMRP